MVLTSRLRAIERVHPVHAMNAEQCQMVWGWEMGWEGDIVFC